MYISADKIQNVIDSMDAFTEDRWRLAGDVIDDGTTFLCWVVDSEVVYCISCIGNPGEWEAMATSKAGFKSGVFNEQLTAMLRLPTGAPIEAVKEEE